MAARDEKLRNENMRTYAARKTEKYEFMSQNTESNVENVAYLWKSEK